MADYMPDTALIARLIFKILPHKPPYRLAMDRTNRQFGETDINVLTLAVVYQGVSFPILLLMLDKRGNSDTTERIRIIERYISLFGRDTIDCILGDREFVGERWIAYLNRKRIRYYLRIRANFNIDDPRTGKKTKASVMFADLKIGKNRHLLRIFRVNRQECYLAAAKEKNREGKPELLIIIAYNQPEKALDAYKERWQIETAFKGLKSSGFNIENTHLADLERIEKPFSIVIVAFAWSFVVGDFVHQHILPVRTLKHGRKAKSLLKYGLELIAAFLLNPLATSVIDVFKFLSCT
jgi:hypothetical protein